MGSIERKERVDLRELKDKAVDVRVDVIEMLSKAGSGHPGGSLSSADILTALYFGGILEHDPGNPTLERRDRFVLSKGHACLLYTSDAADEL